MGTNKLYLEDRCNYHRVALVEDEQLIEFYIEKVSESRLVGNIYKGKVVRVHPAMEMAFVKFDRDNTGFLQLSNKIVDDIDKNKLTRNDFTIKEGDEIICQVIKDEIGKKSAKLSTMITIPAKYLVLNPMSNDICISKKIILDRQKEELYEIVEKARGTRKFGIIVRTNAVNATEADLIKEINALSLKWEFIHSNYGSAVVGEAMHIESNLINRAIRDIMSSDISEVIVNRELHKDICNGFYPSIDSSIATPYDGYDMMEDYNLSNQIEEMTNSIVELSNGATIIIDKTEAMIVLDVNSAKYIGKKNHNLEASALKTNIMAAEEIAKMIRRRNYSGIITVDFIDMEESKNRQYLMECFDKFLSKDRIRTNLVGISELCIVELTRKRIYESIAKNLLQTCPYCNGNGYILSLDYTIMKIRRAVMRFVRSTGLMNLIVEVHPRILEYYKSCDEYMKDHANLVKIVELGIIPNPEIEHLNKFKVYACIENSIKENVFYKGRYDDIPD